MADQEEAKTVQLVDRVLERAIKNGASDIHIEPRQDEIRIRFRIDGVLIDRPPLAAMLGQSVTSRLKVMANVDIAEKRLPQDGTFRFNYEGQDVDVRMSTFPTEYGEKSVLRLLIRDGSTLNLKAIGLPRNIREQVTSIAHRSLGMLLITGPTGSGKTSTLYSILGEIDANSRNIMTLEDPIEYRFENVIQGQTNQKIGFTFASGLRSILRQDPDVILVGEMRDGETASIAFKSALTGHLVLSSIHTNSAPH